MSNDYKYSSTSIKIKKSSILHKIYSEVSCVSFFCLMIMIASFCSCSALNDIKKEVKEIGMKNE